MGAHLKRAVALVIGAFVLYTATEGPFDALVQRSVMVALVVTLGFLSYPLKLSGRARIVSLAIDLLLWAGTMAACLYVTFSANWIMTSLPMAGPVEIALAAVLVVTLLELARRTVGIAFPILVLVGFAYVFLGHLIPGRLGHRGYDILFVTETLYLSDIGVWGSLTGIASTIIAAFVLFGAMLLRTGGGDTFMDLALLVSGRTIGGAAKMATVASASFGTVNGSAVANVATTGTMTIPLMKRIGYPAPIAAAVEAVVFLSIHLIALRQKIGYVPPEEIPSARTALAPVRLVPVVFGLGGLLWMLISGRSVALSAATGVICMIVPFVIADLAITRRPIETAKTLLGGLVEAGNGIVIIALMLAGAQILVSLINLTGVGVTLSSLTVAIGGESSVLVGLIVAVACLVLGMGIPTTAAYVLVAAVMAPALIAIGIEPLVAHMFVFYYATISVITPPVCIAVFVAASIAKTDWWPAALNAVRLGAVTYVVPFMFLSYPGMLWSGTPIEIAEAALSSATLVLATSLFLSGTTVRDSRMLAAALYIPAAVLAIVPSEVALVVAIVLTGAGLALGRPFRHPPEFRPGADPAAATADAAG